MAGITCLKNRLGFFKSIDYIIENLYMSATIFLYKATTLSLMEAVNMKKLIPILVVLLVLFGLVSALRGETVKGTITGFDHDTVIITAEDGDQVFTIGDYHDYIPTGDQWEVGDMVELRYTAAFKKVSIKHLT